jgi:hypothetical protein
VMVCSSGYAATDTSWQTGAANSSALTVAHGSRNPYAPENTAQRTYSMPGSCRQSMR